MVVDGGVGGSAGICTVSYADDDITIVSLGKFESTVCGVLQKALRLVERW